MKAEWFRVGHFTGALAADLPAPLVFFVAGSKALPTMTQRKFNGIVKKLTLAAHPIAWFRLDRKGSDRAGYAASDRG